ncbi:MAG: type VI secretion system baseplate subunit TssG [Acidobacteria bacterium]|nr:type VI secretion system baseplate subunit TssG [Acidobacteriota bacterium]
MAGQERTATPALTGLLEALEREPWAHDFFQALRRLDCARPGAARLGHALRPGDEQLRLGQEPSVAFAPSTIAAFRRGEGGAPHRLWVHFLGLFGPNGPLPLHLTEYVRGRMRNAGDRAHAAFADLFHHRMLGLYYRAWAAAQPAANFDRPDEDRFALYFGALFGAAGRCYRGRDEVPQRAKLHFAGRLAAQARSADGLEAILSDWLGVPATVEPFVGAWFDVPQDQRWRLAESPQTGSLGTTAVVGARTFERQQSFRLGLGPLHRADYERFLPGGPSLARVAAMVRFYTNDEFDWDVNLVLRRDEVPPLVLDGSTRLGVTTWLAGDKLDRDPADLVVRAVA